VVSSSSAWAHGVIPEPGAVHLCYCHNPFRYAWNAREDTLAQTSPLLRPVLANVLSRWRQWDYIAAQRVDAYVANSDTTRLRIERYLGRDAAVLHPPVEVERFRPVARDALADHYLVLSELMPHKRIDVAVRAFTELGLPLVVAGNGPDARRLQRLAGPTVRFAGRVSDAEAASLLARSRALVVTATEEFGIAAVEAQAAGRPVIALRDGGVLETVIEGSTGTFFGAPTPESLIEAVQRFDTLAIDPDACTANANRFAASRFRQRFRALVDQTLAGEHGGAPAARVRPRRRARGLALHG